jgi:hypothetical protein
MNEFVGTIVTPKGEERIFMNEREELEAHSELLGRAIDARRALFEATVELKECEQRYYKEKFGVEIDGIVLHQDAEYLVTKVDHFGFPRKPWVEGAKRRKDGEWSKRSIVLYNNWEVKQ